MHYNEYFKKLWLNTNETEIFLALYRLGVKPASTVAKNVNMERTYVYKTLNKLSKQWLISETIKNWVKHFFITDLWVLKKHIQSKITNYEKLDNEFESIKSQLLKPENNLLKSTPKITIFDSIDWINNLYNDILEYLKINNYICIKLFASNTFESQANIHSDIKKYSKNFFNSLKENKITVETYLGNWIITMEKISRTIDFMNLYKLPASNSAVNIYIVWKIVYIIIFKEIYFGIKIDSEDLAHTMHFIFENIK